jgi:F-type H+-transporting ATPase subunit a
MANIPEINLAPDVLTTIGPVPITNAFLATLATSLILLIIAFIVRRKAGIIPTRPQMAFELVYEFIYEKMVMSFGDEERAQKFFPLIFTIFLFLLIANQFALIPFIQSIVTEDGISLLRTPTSDYSLPIALTILILVIANGLALMISPLRHIGNFIKFESFFKMKSIKDLPMACLDFFLGLMDIIGEVAKLASLSTRLFGNIFAGEVIITIITGLMFYSQFLVPIPFLVLSTLAGLVQAFVFAMLSIIFISSSLNGVRKEESPA